jgi:hypothetical protein
MELDNRTPYPAGLFRTIITDTRFAAAALARVTYDIVEACLVPSKDQPWIISFPPRETEYGTMNSDECFYRGGVDLFLFGHACAPGGRPVNQMNVVIEVGEGFRRSVMITGDRVWQKVGEKIVPSEPKPFLSIPLTLENAFGGKQEWDGLDMMYVDNPLGKGYYLEESNAIGQPLPNIEEPNQLITSWEDKPEPAGLGMCPTGCSLRMLNGMKSSEDGSVELLPTFFNSAFPAMIIEKVNPGDHIRVSGVSPDRSFEFTVPDTQLYVRLQFDSQVTDRRLWIDQIGVESDRNRIFITYRYPFRYYFYPLQRRSCELFLGKPPEPQGVTDAPLLHS